MFGNRTICAIGRGDSSRRALGLKPANLVDIERAMDTIKSLAEGRAIATPAGDVRIPWVDDGHLDAWMAGYGPKALALVGRRADGFVLQFVDPLLLQWTLEHVHRTAREADRDPTFVGSVRRRARLRGRRSATSARPMPRSTSTEWGWH